MSRAPKPAGGGRAPSMSAAPRPLVPALVGIGLCLLAASASQAADPVAAYPSAGEVQASPADGFYVHFGPGALLFNAGATVKAAGAMIPGGTVRIDPNQTLITEFGYRWRSLGVSLTGGYPPVATVDGAGSLASLGTLGRIRYGPTVLTVHYHFMQFGRFQPYVGAGPVFLLIFQDQDGAIHHLDVRDHVGAAVQLGAEYGLSGRWSLFFDAKKALLKTNATALLGQAPISADIRLDPLVVAGGLSYRF
jgi:outer membrane protein